MIKLKTYALYECNENSAIIMNLELLVFELYKNIVEFTNTDMKHACNLMILFKIV